MSFKSAKNKSVQLKSDGSQGQHTFNANRVQRKPLSNQMIIQMARDNMNGSDSEVSSGTGEQMVRLRQGEGEIPITEALNRV